MLLNNEWVNQKIKEEIKNYRETNANVNKIVQNLWDVAKVFLRGTIITLLAYLSKQEKSQINNLTLHLKKQGKEKANKTETSRRKEIIKIRAEIIDIETEKQKQKQKTPIEYMKPGNVSLKRSKKLINF